MLTGSLPPPSSLRPSALACIHTVGILGQSEPVNGWQWRVILQWKWKLILFELNWKGPESENLALSEAGSFVWLVLGRSDILSHFNGDLNFTLLIPAFTAYQNQNYFVGSFIEFNADTTFNIYSSTLPATQSRSVEKMMGGGEGGDWDWREQNN